jgi:hypothetical protein
VQRLILPLFALLSLPALAQQQRPPKPADRNKLVQLRGIDVKGTRLPGPSIIRLSGLKIGQQVNYPLIDIACRKITSTGLVKSIDYHYDLTPGQAAIVLSLNLTDELPLLPAKIVPAEASAKIWGCLQAADPVFTHELPNTKTAIHFYTANIETCITSHGQQDAYVAATVACLPNGKATGIVFDIRHK